MNTDFNQSLTLAIQIFKGEYHRQFFKQLIASQLDVDRLDYLMNNEQKEIPARYRSWVTRSNIDVNRSDIKAVVRAELKTLLSNLKSSQYRFSDQMSKIHVQDLIERVDLILNPNK